MQGETEVPPAATTGSEERAVLAELRAIVGHPEAPFYPELPQVDAASRWYVTLASKVDEVCEKLGIEAAGE